ncbi:MAG: UDP-2,3-diacylglucosamine diphosphatase LpxI [Pseudomonadota bacterium]
MAGAPDSARGPLGIIAGLGELPVSIAAQCVAEDRPVYILRVKGFEEPGLAPYPGETVGFGEIGRQVSLLKAAGVRDLVFAGIVKRPDFSALKLDGRGARLLPKVLMAARKGDDALLRVLLDAFEQEGFAIISAEAANARLVVKQGHLAGPAPTDANRADGARALAAAREIGRLDIGQGCVVCDGLVLAVEAQEGTDAMLARIASLPPEIRGTPDARRGVLAKAPKPIQERRVDLPTVGPATVEGAAAAGLAGIFLEEGGALLLDRDRTLAQAAAMGLFIHVVPAAGPVAAATPSPERT